MSSGEEHRSQGSGGGTRGHRVSLPVRFSWISFHAAPLAGADRSSFRDLGLECVRSCRGCLSREARRGERRRRRGRPKARDTRGVSKPEMVHRGRELPWQPRSALTPGRSSVFRVIRKRSIIRGRCILSCRGGRPPPRHRGGESTAPARRRRCPETCVLCVCATGEQPTGERYARAARSEAHGGRRAAPTRPEQHR